MIDQKENKFWRVTLYSIAQGLPAAAAPGKLEKIFSHHKHPRRAE